MSSTVETATDIRPFHIDVPDEALEDLRRRIAATIWPEKETVADQSQGVPLAMIQNLARYWMTDYGGWRTCEANLNALPAHRAARSPRSRGLLDVDVHQLAAHGVVHPCVGRLRCLQDVVYKASEGARP